ncbi:MAG: hypothetical protein HN348_18775 [Proteobacteria bacterium]|jgi:hypothetical protein|nr:hypothetical protein [Pseudomonadota bacterium]
MVDVDIDYNAVLHVTASAAEAFALVADVKRSASHYPDLAVIVPVDGKGHWRWTMKEKGVGRVTLQVIYSAIYWSDESKLRVDWKPPPGGGGDMESFGSWEVFPADGGSTLHFRSHTISHIPVPRLVNKVAQKVARKEITGRNEGYVAAITNTLGRRTC